MFMLAPSETCYVRKPQEGTISQVWWTVAVVRSQCGWAQNMRALFVPQRLHHLSYWRVVKLFSCSQLDRWALVDDSSVTETLRP